MSSTTESGRWERLPTISLRTLPSWQKERRSRGEV